MKRPMQAGTKRGNQGFSLLELMIAVTVLGIVTAAAVATYGNSMVKTRRGTAKAATRLSTIPACCSSAP